MCKILSFATVWDNSQTMFECLGLSRAPQATFNTYLVLISLAPRGLQDAQEQLEHLGLASGESTVEHVMLCHVAPQDSWCKERRGGRIRKREDEAREQQPLARRESHALALVKQAEPPVREY